MSVSKAIRLLRERRSLSARALSIAAGLSPSYVSKVESEKLVPSLTAFAAMARVLRMTDAEVLMLVGLS